MPNAPAKIFDPRPCRNCGGRVELVPGTCVACSSKHLRPLPGPQTDFLACEADIVLFGGGMGSGKTRSMLLDWLRHSTTPGANGLLARNRLAEIKKNGGLWDQAMSLYSGTAGVSEDGITIDPRSRAGEYMDMTWPSGAKLGFKHLDDRNRDRFKGPEYTWIGIEEADECTMETIMWLYLARGRTTTGARPVLRMTCNPNPDSVLAQWVEPYLILDPDHVDYGRPDRSKSGMIMYLARSLQSNKFDLDSDLDRLVARTGQDPANALTFAYIPSLLQDNIALPAGYSRRLASMDAFERARNLEGNWKVRREVGGILRFQWWGQVDRPLAPIVRRVRAWDKAVRRPRPEYPNPDYTVGIRVEWDIHGRWYVTDMVACREEIPEVERLMTATAAADGPSVMHVLEVEGGAGGPEAARHGRDVLRRSGRCGPVIELPARKNKLEKSRPMASELRRGMDANKPRQSEVDDEAGEVHQPRGFILLNGWTERPYSDAGEHPPTLGALFWQQVTPFWDPDADHDDVPDALAIAHSAPKAPTKKRESAVAHHRRLI